VKPGIPATSFDPATTYNLSQNNKSSSDRIRDNQRRSRAQRKGYLRELEEKWQKCVEEGVNASREIQAAARKVEEENKRLKALLRVKGVSEREISGLEGIPTERWEATFEGSALARVLEERRPCYAAAQTTSKHGAILQTSNATSPPLSIDSTHDTDCPYDPYLTNSTSSTALPSRVDVSSHYLSPNVQDQTPSTAWSDNVTLAHQPGGESVEATTNDARLSCEYAASIITAMKYDASALQIKRELGCGENTDCKVGHTALFEVMDKYSGDL